MSIHTWGHLTAMLTVLVWGTTFVSTKLLLFDYTPIEILFFRFILGFCVLALCKPQRLHTLGWQEDKYLVAAGFCGITLYFLLENIALTYTYASNVCLILALVPFLTALCSSSLLGEAALSRNFFWGFAFAMGGLLLIVFNGSVILKLNPLGDLLALLAAIVWSIYSVLLKKISTFNYDTLLCTRNIFGYGLVLMLPALFFMDFQWGFYRLENDINLFNLVYLGVGASALCFWSWSWAIKAIGPVKTSMYIYISPVVTLITSALILQEQITWLAGVGTTLILAGLVLSGQTKPPATAC
ncbi:MAG: DMT family transporter [Acidaminococcaceae bacterium]